MTQLLSFARFELGYHLRRPVTYVYMWVMFMFAFLFAATDIVQVGGVDGKVHINGPHAVGQAIMALTMIGTALTSAIAGTAVLRDFEFKVHELLFTTRLSKPAFVLGRFLGAYLITVLVFACTVPGLQFGYLMPWLDADKLGPGVSGMYLQPLLVYVLPNALLVSALFFAVGILSRSFMAVYVAGIALFLGYNIALQSIADIDNEALGAMLDPFGILATGLDHRNWTPHDRNTLLTPLTGLLLWNRVVWTGAALAALAGAYALFRMEAQAGVRRRKRKGAAPVDAPDHGPRAAPAPLPPATQHAGPAAALAGFVTLTRLYYLNVVRERVYQALVAIGMIFTVFTTFQADSLFGTKTWPVTYVVLDTIGVFFVFFFIISAIYAGDLTWRERALRCDQIHDATPVSTTATFAGRIAALLLAHATLLLPLILAGVAVQTLKGYHDYQLGLYFGYLYGFQWPSLALLVCFSFFVHALVDHKPLGIVLVIAFYMFTFLAMPPLGLDHNLYRFDGFPAPSVSAMNGYGPDVAAYLTFLAYYGALSLVLLALARLLVVRGTAAGWRARLRVARARVTGRWLAFTAAALLAWLGLGGWIFYNTNVLHTYRSSKDEEALRAAFEREYKQYEKLPQPRIVASEVAVDIYPERGHATAKGTYKLVNRHAAPIETVHVYLDEAVTIRALEFDRPSTLERDDARLRYQIHRLAAPLGPGEELQLRFDLGYLKEGFGNRGRRKSIVENGTFFNNAELMPGIGYNPEFELADADDRKKHGLPERPRMPSIDDMDARQNTYIAHDSDWIDFAATVCTSPDQIAVAPGYLQREWTADGRRCFAYAMDAKILHFYSFLSARYEVLRDQHNGVAIEIYYQKGHEYNLERMVDAIKQSLDYFQANFSPYQHRQVRILEFPRYATFAQSFPNTIPYSEAIGFIARVRPGHPDDLDYPFYVTAHEVAHQWWAHQVIGANVQGATMLSESLSQYSALMVMEKEYGPAKMKKFLQYELRGYLSGRGGERKKELPLALNENQQYIHYQKGSLVFYALKDYLGEDVLNAALARYIKQVAFQGPPFTTTRDLLAILREVTPPELQYLIEDMFETITLYDNKVLDLAAEDLGGGKHRVTLKLQARKLRADELGAEQEVPMQDFIDVGVFAAPGPDEELGAPLLLERRRLTQGEHTIEVVVDGVPARAGVDPYNKLIDRTPRDNTRAL
jgi:hypothetical protein